MREEGVCSHCESGPRSLGKRACGTAPRYAQSRFTASWTHCNLATGLRGFSPLVFSGEFHTPRLPETLQVVGSASQCTPTPTGHTLSYTLVFARAGQRSATNSSASRGAACGVCCFYSGCNTSLLGSALRFKQSSSATWNDVRFELKHRARMGAT